MLIPQALSTVGRSIICRVNQTLSNQELAIIAHIQELVTVYRTTMLGILATLTVASQETCFGIGSSTGQHQGLIHMVMNEVQQWTENAKNDGAAIKRHLAGLILRLAPEKLQCEMRGIRFGMSDWIGP